jgi:hypothetical protein
MLVLSERLLHLQESEEQDGLVKWLSAAVLGELAKSDVEPLRANCLLLEVG